MNALFVSAHSACLAAVDRGDAIIMQSELVTSCGTGAGVCLARESDTAL